MAAASLSVEDVIARFETLEAELTRLRAVEEEQRTANNQLRAEILELRAQISEN